MAKYQVTATMMTPAIGDGFWSVTVHDARNLDHIVLVGIVHEDRLLVTVAATYLPARIDVAIKQGLEQVLEEDYDDPDTVTYTIDV